MWVVELARARVRQQLDELCAQAPVVGTSDDPEAVHKMRVATRRLRAALRVFEDILPPCGTELGCELKWVAGILGTVRDLDVQIHSLVDASETLQAAPEAADPVVCLFRARRAEAREALVAALAAPRFAELIGRLEALLGQAWPAPEAQPDAPGLIRARYRRLRRSGAALGEDAGPRDLHKARIRAKQLRYTLECFANVYGRPARKLIRKTVGLQDVLGAVQDATVMSERLREASLSQPGLPGSSVFLLGQLAEVYAEQVRQARAAAPRRYRGLVGKPWKRLRRRMRDGVPSDADGPAILAR
jgi:CHAD domain-containing protein